MDVHEVISATAKSLVSMNSIATADPQAVNRFAATLKKSDDRAERNSLVSEMTVET